MMWQGGAPVEAFGLPHACRLVDRSRTRVEAKRDRGEKSAGLRQVVVRKASA